MMKKINPQFQSPCYQTLKQDLGSGYQVAKESMIEMLDTTCDNATITTDLSLRMVISELLCIHYLTDKMELRDILLCIEQIKYPHTSDHICETIKIKLDEFNLINKITAAVNNGINMVKAIRKEWSVYHVLHICCSYV